MPELKIIIASQNPVKIEAAKRGFSKMFTRKTLQLQAVSVPSGVSDQPMTNQETIDGAINRCQAAMKEVTDADYYLGIEGGLEPSGNDLEAFAWVAISDQNNLSKARTGSFILPPPITELVNQGMELGSANDQFFKQHNSKQQGGAVGILTQGALDRTAYYEQAVILALIPLLNKALYAV